MIWPYETDRTNERWNTCTVHGTPVRAVKWLAGARNNYFHRRKSLSILSSIDAHSAVHLLPQRWTWLVYARINCPSLQTSRVKYVGIGRQTSRNRRAHGLLWIVAINFNFLFCFLSLAGKAKMIWHVYTSYGRHGTDPRTNQKNYMKPLLSVCATMLFHAIYFIIIFILQAKTFNKAI